MLARFDRNATYMEPITEKDMIILNTKIANKSVTFITRNKKKITNEDILLYGDVNFDNDNDINYINRFKRKLLNPYDYANFYYSTFDYENGTIYKDMKKDVFLGYQLMNDVVKWFKYHYCLIGKPKYFIVYTLPYAKRQSL